MSDAALVVDGLTVTYPNGYQALTDLGLEVGHGESVGLVGASGCGKTTLLRAILGLLPAGTVVRGRVEVDGRNLVGVSPTALRRLRGRLVGYVPQDPFAACDPLRRVRHHVGEAWTAHGQRPPTGAVEDGLARVGIPVPRQRAAQRPHQWSGGMLQRATTLAATVHDPVLTLADEPTSALDAELADGALELLRATCSGLVVVTHDLALAARHTDRVVVLHDGRQIEHGASSSVLAAPSHQVTRDLVAAASPPPRSPRPAPAGAAVVRAEGVARSYRARDGGVVEAVRPATLALHPGEVVGVVGASGSGKSTLLRLLAGVERPDVGAVVAGERPIWAGARLPQLPRKGFVMPVFQDPVGSLDPRWRLWRSITEPLVLAGSRLSHGARRDRAREALASVGMGDVDPDHLPGSLSVGQCQRVAVLRAVIAQPALVVADEPTASLDVQAAAVVSDLLRAAADGGAAVLVVSHDEIRLRSYADRVLRMRDGVIADDD